MGEAAAQFASFGEADWRRAAEAALKGAGFATLVSRAADGIELAAALSAPRRAARAARRPAPGGRSLASTIPIPPPPTTRRSTTSPTAPTVCRSSSPALRAPMASVSPRPIRRPCTAPSRACDSTRRSASSSISGPTARARRPASPRWSRAAASRRTQSTSPSASIRSARSRAAAARRAHGAPRPRRSPRSRHSSRAQGFAGPFFAADARAVHAAGGTPAQELGFATSAAVAYLRALADGGFSREAAAAAIGFRLAADADEFVHPRQVPRPAADVGPRARGLRPRRRAGASPRRERVADDDARATLT